MKPWRCVLPILLGLATAFAVGAEDRWLAVIGGTVFDGTGTVHTSATVLVKNARIDAIGAAAAVPIPNAAERLAAAGKFVLPGLVALHFHYDPKKTPWLPLHFLANGVTTQREMGRPVELNKKWLADSKAAGLPRPRGEVAINRGTRHHVWPQANSFRWLPRSTNVPREPEPCA